MEVGDILAITNAGAYIHGVDLRSHYHKPVPEHYLNARRICQVTIWSFNRLRGL
ncbi:MAG: hypothetical protein H8D67_09555 [Deltaproteobacteria bacterium]|nr:hypothetical protein [Deltaproteobacteria bacterium]MBL7175722.1 hypothetical protein [Desulfobacteraceae bacterium]